MSLKGGIDMSSAVKRPNGVISKGHVEGLSDGIFSVAMTILVLNLVVPVISETQTNRELTQSIFELWPKFLASLLSFLILAVAWIQQRFILHHLRRIDNKMVWFHILFLMFIVLVPFSTSLLGKYWQYETSYFVIGGNFVALLLFLSLILIYGKKYKLLGITLTQESMKWRITVDCYMIAIILIAVGLSYVNPIISLSLMAVLTFFTVFGTFMGLHERGTIEEE
jgi:uncharacterized membrane protein